MTRRWRYAAFLVLIILIASPMIALGAQQTQGTVTRYVVQRGDTLADIAIQMGVSASALAKANGLSNVDKIYTGQALIVPGKTTPASPAKPTDQPATDNSGSAKPPTPKPTTPPTSAPTPAAAPTTKPAANAQKWIDINLTEQRLTAYEGQTAVFTTLISSGIAHYPTPIGTFAIQDHLLFKDMKGPGYYLRNVPNVMHFKAGGFAIHGTYWHHNFGHPMSHGCINLTIPDSAWMYNWAPVGTKVVIHR